MNYIVTGSNENASVSITLTIDELRTVRSALEMFSQYAFEQRTANGTPRPLKALYETKERTADDLLTQILYADMEAHK